MSTLSDYVKGAVGTESTIDSIKLNEKFLTHILKMHIASGNILDQIKKHAFYNRSYDDQTIDDNLVAIYRAIKSLAEFDDEEITRETVLQIDPRIFHAILGTATESVELLEALEYTGGEMDLVNIGEEFGDLNWYQAIFCDASNTEWETILSTNAEKLYKANNARYKDGFADDAANKRNLDDEREILSDNLNKPD